MYLCSFSSMLDMGSAGKEPCCAAGQLTCWIAFFMRTHVLWSGRGTSTAIKMSTRLNGSWLLTTLSRNAYPHTRCHAYLCALHLHVCVRVLHACVPRVCMLHVCMCVC